jgi:antitoxin component of MazEF toxin-antitoxin module
MVVSLPKQMLEALQLAEGEEVSVELDAENTRIVITPSTGDADGVDAQFAKQVADFIEQYRPALEALAR